jgi:hypothetical protein
MKKRQNLLSPEIKESFDLGVPGIIINNWSRSHQGSRNYCLIEQEVQILYNYKHGTAYSHLGGLKILQDYQIDTNREPKAEDYDYIRDTMSPKNQACKDYTYFRVVLANGTDLICRSWEEFLSTIGQPEQ